MHPPQLCGVFKDVGSRPDSAWAEVYLGTTAPVAINDYMDTKIVARDTWNHDDWDSTFGEACVGSSISTCSNGKVIIDTPASGGPLTYYLVLKVGGFASFDVVVDEVSLKKVTETQQVVAGDFGPDSEASWSQTTISGTPNPVNFNYTTNTPLFGEGPALHLSGNGGSNQTVYQKLTLEIGKTYALSGAFKDIGSSDTWCEIYLGETEPVSGKDYLAYDLPTLGYQDNATPNALPAIDFTTASFEEIRNYFRLIGTLHRSPNAELYYWLSNPDVEPSWPFAP